MNELDVTQKTTLQLPARYDVEARKAFWKAQGQPWRTQSQIDAERQHELAKRLNTQPNEKKGIYPFGGIKLNRADIEWLLTTHEDGRGPVDWNDESQREREGLDLRGADLRYEDLSELPLSKLLGGVSWIVEDDWTEDQKTKAAVKLEGTNLSWAHLEGAHLGQVQLKGAKLNYAQLENVNLCFAQIEDTELQQAQLKSADIRFAKLKNVNFFHAKLVEANFYESQLEEVNFLNANLTEAHLRKAQLNYANFNSAQLDGAFLQEVQLKGANLGFAKLKGANLSFAQLDGAHLSFAQLKDADLRLAQLDGAHLMNTVLANSEHIGPKLADIQWGDVNLAVVDWSEITILGDENEAIQEIDRDDGKKKAEGQRISEYKSTVRAYRQLSVVLHNQGLNEDAARFTYRAQLMQRKVFFYQRQYLSYLGSHFLDRLSGYGYKWRNAFLSYLFVIVVFAAIYYHISPHLAWYESIVISMTAFHGRGFFPTQFNPGDPQAIAAAIEALVGLFIEITLIATLTQRLFGK